MDWSLIGAFVCYSVALFIFGGHIGMQITKRHYSIMEKYRHDEEGPEIVFMDDLLEEEEIIELTDLIEEDEIIELTDLVEEEEVIDVTDAIKELQRLIDEEEWDDVIELTDLVEEAEPEVIGEDEVQMEEAPIDVEFKTVPPRRWGDERRLRAAHYLPKRTRPWGSILSEFVSIPMGGQDYAFA